LFFYISAFSFCFRFFCFFYFLFIFFFDPHVQNCSVKWFYFSFLISSILSAVPTSFCLQTKFSF
jgi:hypothetical protein